MQQDHRKDMAEVFEQILTRDSYALSRAADGEAGVLKNITIGNKDGWLYKRNQNLLFRRDLRRSLMCQDEGFVYGISNFATDPENHRYLKQLIKQDLSHMTYSGIFANANHAPFLEQFPEVLRRSGKKISLITGNRAKPTNLSTIMSIDDVVTIAGNCVRVWERKKDYLMGLLDLKASVLEPRIFLIAMGPLTNVIVYEMWQINRQHIYLDIGSALDPILFERESRHYHRANHRNRNLINEWES